jgi:hypothetical protein
MKPGSLGKRSSRPKQRSVLGKTSSESLTKKTLSKTWDSFMECITFCLQQVFMHNTGKVLKYYITNMIRKPKRVPIHQFLVRIEQINIYLKPYLACITAQAQIKFFKKVLPLDNADLAKHFLHMCPVKWPAQYNLTKKMTPVNTRALLLIHEKIKNNAEVETKPPGTIKTKGAKGERKMESIDFCIPKSLNRWALAIDTVPCAN